MAVLYLLSGSAAQTIKTSAETTEAKERRTRATRNAARVAESATLPLELK
jgi:hypothetical protein